MRSNPLKEHFCMKEIMIITKSFDQSILSMGMNIRISGFLKKKIEVVHFNFNEGNI
jgi:hypothetical protein